MQNLQLSNLAALMVNSSGKERQPGIPRRQFLGATIITGAYLAFSPKSLFAQTAGETKAWRDLLNNFFFTVADDGQARRMASRIRDASIDRVSRENAPFHWTFSSPLIVNGSTIEQQRVICDNGFQLVQLPRYDVGCPCRSTNDLNEPEMRTVIDPGVIRTAGCVLAPDGERTRLTLSDHVVFDEAARKYPEYNEWKVTYKRRMSGARRAHVGYHFVHKTRTNVYGRALTKFVVGGDI